MTVQQRVLVLGASGYLGRQLCRQLSVDGHDVIPAGTSRAGGIDVAIDITDPNSVYRGLVNVAPDAVVNLSAAGVDPQRRPTADLSRMIRVNSLGPATLVLSGSKVPNPPRLVHIGTSRELSVGHARSAREFYGSTKRAGSTYMAMAFGVGDANGLVLRVHSVYGGPQPVSRLFAALLASARSGRSIELVEPDTRLDYVHITDVIHAIISAVSSGVSSSQVLDISTGRTTSVADLARHVYTTVGADPGLIERRLEEVEPYELVGDPETAKAMLGWESQINLIDGVRLEVDSAL